MKRLISHIFCLSLAAVAAPVLASTTSAETRSYVHSCGYFTSKSADVALTYENRDLPWGTVVELVYALEGQHGVLADAPRVDWQNERRLVLTPSAAYTWSAEVTVETHYRSSARNYDGLQFVYRIIYPDDSVAYDNGAPGAWSHYRVKFVWDTTCVGGGAERPAYTPVDVEAIDRS
jgi:hypothetical protein